MIWAKITTMLKLVLILICENKNLKISFLKHYIELATFSAVKARPELNLNNTPVTKKWHCLENNKYYIF